MPTSSRILHNVVPDDGEMAPVECRRGVVHQVRDLVMTDLEGNEFCVE